MYIAITGSKNNKDVYIYQSFRKKDGKSSSRIYKKLGKYNTLLEQFDGDEEKLMACRRPARLWPCGSSFLPPFPRRP